MVPGTTSHLAFERPMMNSLGAIALTSMALALSACSGVGPVGLANGRSTYNAVINETEDQQTLSMIVRLRYAETFGMLSVSSVTASLRVSTSAGANFGIGPDRSFEGNLVPLSIGAAYEENPVITYVPLRGEEFIRRMLAPISAEQTLLLSRMSSDEVEVLRILVRRANGLENALFASGSRTDSNREFDRFLELFALLRERGELDVIQSSDGSFELLIHDWKKDQADVDELLDVARIRAEHGEGRAFTVPLRFFVGSPRDDGLDLETPSALEVIEAAGAGVEIPEDHRVAGLVSALPQESGDEFLRIRVSEVRPDNATVAVKHRDHWFFVDDGDTRSKRAFMILRTLIGLRLDQAATGSPTPTLTVPLGR